MTLHRPPPDPEAHAFGPQKIVAVVTTLTEVGVAPESVLLGSSLEMASLNSAETRISYRQLATVFRNALRLAPDPSVAFRAGSRMHLTAYGIWGYGLLSSPTHEDQIEFVLKYSNLIGPVAGTAAVRHDGLLWAYVHEVYLTPDPADPLYWFALEFAFSALLTLSRDLHGGAFSFAALHAACPAPPHASIYPELFGCPVEFNCKDSEAMISTDWSDFRTRIPDAVTHSMALQLCQQALIDLAHSGGVASIVRRTLVEKMPWRFPTLETMAAEIALHPRTLRRRLEREGTTYRNVLIEVRRKLAIEYLLRTFMTTEEIATRLGYSDAANFRHAFLRWTGRTPQEYRSMRGSG